MAHQTPTHCNKIRQDLTGNPFILNDINSRIMPFMLHSNQAGNVNLLMTIHYRDVEFAFLKDDADHF